VADATAYDERRMLTGSHVECRIDNRYDRITGKDDRISADRLRLARKVILRQPLAQRVGGLQGLLR